MSLMIEKPAGKEVGCDPAQLAKRGWLKGDDLREPTCIRMLPMKNKDDDDEIWVPAQYCNKPEEPPSDEELKRLSHLLAEEPDKLTKDESTILCRFLPTPKFDELFFKRAREKKASKSKEPKASIPFVYEGGGDSLHNCRICGKKDHFDVDCSYMNFVPQGVNVGPEYMVVCRICGHRVSQPVGDCQSCGTEGGRAVMKVCIFCLCLGDHLPEDCPRTKRHKTRSKSEDALIIS
ncbi:uncharacterized protein LOC112179702 [Rosa chinensis]|uniref:uncharacterized protein LOC112179702 n=1 Tax=Rosa chinensis TaxID=74649 RepID=UPI000D089869|nr:uncharacterized protein LOC112179702 [Rosa chinensis]